MWQKNRISRILYITGIVAIIAGALDPLEGSVIIVGGSALISLSAYLVKDRHRNIFLAAFLLILLGVFFLFWLSSRGGFGGNSSLSWWWGLLIIPYPVGWVITVIIIAARAFRKKRFTEISES